jgi:redox-sensitive bicupin YhaK (pirin superfamily)
VSIHPTSEPACHRESGAIELLIEPQAKNLGAFDVRRALPAPDRQRVGPFIFFDHMGPADLAVGAGMDVRPHPHIGIATVTYLFEGEILHRDSLGFVQPILPGAVNWMTAGRGIVHSERSPPEAMARVSRLHGIQTWLALPLELEEMEPAFTHYPADVIPECERDGVRIRLIAGVGYGLESPVRVASETFYAAIDLRAGASLRVPADIEERAVYVVSGQVELEGAVLPAGTMAVLRSGVSVSVSARDPARLMLLGGDPLAGDRILYWNFVSSRSDRIERARQDWRDGRFARVPGETEFIPLPDTPVNRT